MAEEPQDSSKFDVSDLETTQPETPKAKKKHAAKMESMPAQKPSGAGHPLPGVHERPKKQGRKLNSGGKLNASVAGEIVPEAPPSSGKSDVEDALDMVRGMTKERAEEDAEWDAKIAEAKRKAEAEGQVIEFEAEPQSEAEREEYEWDAKLAAAKAAPPAFTDQEEAWFKKGEEEEMQAIRAGIEAHGNAPLIETPAEIDANVRQAEAMIAAGELNPEMFNAKDYRYLLNEKARIDADLEVAGWWKARSLRAELREITKDLAGYEEQVQRVVSGRRPSGDLTAREKEDIRYKGPAQKPVLPEGSGTSIYMNKKPGFFSRLFGRK